MRAFCFYGVFFSILSFGVCACDSGSDLIVVKNTIENQRANFYCDGNKKCIPIVEIWGTESYLEVTWLPQEFGNDHRLFLECSGADGNVYRSEPVESRGSWSFYFSSPLDAYTIHYSIRCQEDQCSLCNGFGSFHKKSRDDNGSMGSYYECFKEYYDYRISKNSSGKVILERDWDYPNPERMDIDKMTIYKRNFDGKYLKYNEISVSSIGVGRLEVYSHDLAEPSSNGVYVAVLTSSQCVQAINEHYLYFSYNAMNGSLVLPMATTKVNNH